MSVSKRPSAAILSRKGVSLFGSPNTPRSPHPIWHKQNTRLQEIHNTLQYNSRTWSVFYNSQTTTTKSNVILGKVVNPFS